MLQCRDNELRALPSSLSALANLIDLDLTQNDLGVDGGLALIVGMEAPLTDLGLLEPALGSALSA